MLTFEARAGHMTTPSPSQQEVTQLLADWSDGDEGALDKLIPLVQPELHRLAHHYMRRERTGHTLQTTALLNEAYLQLVDDSTRNWQNRTHFIAGAAQLMRRIMVDHARVRCSLKRGGGALRVTLDDAALVTEKRSEELLALDEALERLAAQDPRKSRIVELRYFGGLTEEETAAFLKLSDRTVRREWRMARTWLYRALSGKEPDET
jgi:RNA polymerase sigma-70 factor (ECF subfamily)